MQQEVLESLEDRDPRDPLGAKVSRYGLYLLPTILVLRSRRSVTLHGRCLLHVGRAVTFSNM